MPQIVRNRASRAAQRRDSLRLNLLRCGIQQFSRIFANAPLSSATSVAPSGVIEYV